MDKLRRGLMRYKGRQAQRTRSQTRGRRFDHQRCSPTVRVLRITGTPDHARHVEVKLNWSLPRTVAATVADVAKPYGRVEGAGVQALAPANFTA